MPHLIELRFLGGAAILEAGVPVSGPVSQRLRVALLAVLAAAGPGGVTRETALALLWPETDEPRGRHALSNALYVVRRALGDGAIRSAGDGLVLDEAAIRSDVGLFRRALAEDDVVGAVEAYHGPFLDGFGIGSAEFEDWSDGVRRSLAREWLDCVERLARDAARRGDRTEAAHWWRRASAQNPFSSRITLELMAALRAVGDRGVALRIARRHQQLLSERLDLAADPDIEALARAIREEVPEAADVRGDERASLPAPPFASPSPGPLRAAPPPSVARRATRAVLAAASATVLLLSHRTPRSTSRAPSLEPPVRQAYLEGVYRLNKVTPGDVRAAIRAFDEVIQRVPDFAPAYAMLGDSYWLLTQPLGDMEHESGMRLALDAALRAVDLDRFSAPGHTTVGWVRFFHDWDWQASSRAFRRAIALAPERPQPRLGYATLLVALGRTEEGIGLAAEAAALAPVDMGIRTAAAELLYYDRRYDAAETELRKILDVEPRFTRALDVLQWIHEQRGDWARSAELFAEGWRIRTQRGEEYPERDLVERGPRAETREAYWAWRGAIADEEALTGHVPHSVIAWIRAASGDVDGALSALGAALLAREGQLVFMRVDPFWDGLRADPRFLAIERRVGLDDPLADTEAVPPVVERP